MLWVVSFALLTSAAINVFLVTRPAEISEIELWAASIFNDVFGGPHEVLDIDHIEDTLVIVTREGREFLATINIEERVEEP